MKWLGQLVWWSVGAPQVRAEDVEAMLAELGMVIPPPNPIVPIDAFRRLTGGQRREYRLATGEEVTIDLHVAKSRSTMLARSIVRTVRQGGIAVAIDKVGDCAFYKPPRGQNERAQMKVRLLPNPELPDAEQLEQFANDLRQEYRRALTYLDPQALRRLVRQHLAVSHALLLQKGPYFLPRSEDAEALAELLHRFGGGSQCLIFPVVDDEERRSIITRGLEAAISDTDEVDVEYIEAYVPLGVVPESVWALLERKGEVTE